MKKIAVLGMLMVVLTLIAAASGVSAAGLNVFSVLGGFPENVQIKVIPNCPDGTIDLSADGFVTVVVFGCDSFNVMHINAATVTFAGASIPVSQNGIPQYVFRDYDGDRFVDFVANFRVNDLCLDAYSTQAEISGNLIGKFAGTSQVRVRTGLPVPNPYHTPQSSSQFELSAGSELTISLDESIVAGGQWRLLSFDSRVISLVNEQQIPGTGSVKHLFMFKAVGSGRTDLVFRNITSERVFNIIVAGGSNEQVRVGQQFNVQVPSNPSTGFHWEFATPVDETILKLINRSFEPNSMMPGILGAGGLESFTFMAVGQGQTEISLVCISHSGSAGQTASFKVMVY